MAPAAGGCRCWPCCCFAWSGAWWAGIGHVLPALCIHPRGCGAICAVRPARRRQDIHRWAHLGLRPARRFAGPGNGGGLLSDDEIHFPGRWCASFRANGDGLTTRFHSDLGQYLLIGLVALHLLAIGYYVLVRRRTLRPHAAWRQAADPPGTRIARRCGGAHRCSRGGGAERRVGVVDIRAWRWLTCR